MKFLQQCSLINFSQGPSEQQPIRFYHEIFDIQRKTKILIIFNQDHQIIYQQNEVILRIDPSQETPDLLRNLDQIKNLEWQVDNGKNNKKLKKWRAFWKGEIIPEVGGYQENEIKQGLWKELFQQYSNQAKVYEIGEYQMDNRCGRWIHIQEEKKIAGGYYDEKGQKQGKWFDMSVDFNINSQVIYNGQYNAGKKVGLWDTYFDCKGKNQIIKDNWKTGSGGGVYQKESSIKIGIWIELRDGFYENSQIIYKGEYSKNGQKIGRWDTLYRKNEDYEIIGGGQYDENCSIKTGKWIEISDNFEYYSQVSSQGEYKNGEKIGRWDIFYKISDEFKLIGGGQYDEEGSIKFGRWNELSDIFHLDSQVIYQGEYNKNGNKIGRWDILFRGKEEFELIGGGQYDEGSSIKIGEWIELNDSFSISSQVIYKGWYNKNGKKVGRWDILFRRCNKYEQIGGGYYDEENYMKIGHWIELYNKFQNEWEITYTGEYNKNGKKVGKWLEIDIERNKKSIIRSINYDD
ncbi:unnamed protein product [Paramecium sonneborni]|uniref:Uncharacterized protein n=1 Tax=Paramecium sonneborni TaxID=65129 RepID=A0A8S1QKS9_9CILI|nr:unnamed protein product [Paramecium sonneborni]